MGRWAADAPQFYCPNCTCDSCVYETKYLAANAVRLERHERIIAERKAKVEEAQRAKDLRRAQEGMIIAMLLWAYGDPWSVQFETICTAIDQRGTYVTRLRTDAERFLVANVEALVSTEEWYVRLNEARAIHGIQPHFWHRPAGARYTEQPEFCEKCGHMVPSPKAGRRQVCTYCRPNSTKLNGSNV